MTSERAEQLRLHVLEFLSSGSGASSEHQVILEGFCAPLTSTQRVRKPESHANIGGRNEGSFGRILGRFR